MSLLKQGMLLPLGRGRWLILSAPEMGRFLRYLYKPETKKGRLIYFAYQIPILVVLLKYFFQFLSPRIGSSDVIATRYITLVCQRGRDRKYICYLPDTAEYVKWTQMPSSYVSAINREIRMLNFVNRRNSKLRVDVPNPRISRDHSKVQITTPSVCSHQTSQSLRMTYEDALRFCENFESLTELKVLPSEIFLSERHIRLARKRDKNFDIGIGLSYYKGLCIPAVFSHGDFSPWNVFKAGDTYAVVDFEAARIRFPRYHDIVNYFYSLDCLIDKRTNQFWLNNVFTFIEKKCMADHRVPLFILHHYCFSRFIRGISDYLEYRANIEFIRDQFLSSETVTKS